MLAEGVPEVLMNKFNCDSLESLFVTLSAKQERDHNLINSQQQDKLISRFDELKVSKLHFSKLFYRKSIKNAPDFTDFKPKNTEKTISTEAVFD